MIEVTLTDEMKTSAKQKADDLGELRHSFLKGAGNYVGFLGEEVALKVLEGKRENTFDYDMKVGRKKIDVKARSCKSKPKPEYLCTIPSYNPNQKCDYYCFVRVDVEKNKAYYLGVIAKKAFYKKAEYHRKGTKGDGPNQWRYKIDTYTVPISELKEGFRIK